MDYHAVIFDLDGVLWHSTSAHASAFAEVFLEHGIEEFEYRQYAGQRTREVILQVFQQQNKNCPEELCARLAKQKTERVWVKIRESQPIEPRVVELLAALQKRVPLALASSGSRGSVGLFLELSGTGPLFESVLSGDDVRNAKPDPEIYLETIRRLGVESGQTLVVEDASAGVKAAKGAGARVAGLPGTESAEMLRLAGANLTINSLNDLIDLIDAGIEERSLPRE